MKMLTRKSLVLGITSLACSGIGNAQNPIGHSILGQDRGHVALLNEKGEVTWEIECRHNSHDIGVLPNGNFLIHIAYNKIVEMTPEKQVVWEWTAKPVAPYSGTVEIHGFQRLRDGRTMIAETGNLRIIEVDSAGEVKKIVPITTDRPDSHRDTRRVRKLDNGNYLVCHEGLGKVREYNDKGVIVWEYVLDLAGQPATGGHDGHGTSVFNAVRLKNGNTLIGGGNNNRVIEVSKDGTIVWKIDRDELKRPDGRSIHLCWVTNLHVLSNGNVVFGNTHSGPENPQMVEVTRDKKVVWMLDNWKVFGNDLCAVWLLDAKRGTIR